MDHHHIIFSNGVAMQLYGIHTILLRIGFLYGHRGQLARLAGRHEARTELIGQNTSSDKSTRLDPYHLRNTSVGIKVSQLLAHKTQCRAILDHSGQISENNSF